MKAIDWRLRPPYKSFPEGLLYKTVRQGNDLAPSVRNLSMEDLINEMDEANIRYGVVPFRKGQDNAEMVTLNAEYPDRFKCLAHVDPFEGQKALDDIDQAINDYGAAGIIIEPGQIFLQKAITPDNEIIYPIYEKCQKEDILLTITFGGLLCAKLENYDPIYMDRVAVDFPDLRIVIAHGGWPYVAQICHVAYQRANVNISPDCYFMDNHPMHQEYVVAANNMLQDKIVFGTGYPGAKLQEGVYAYIRAGLKDECIPKVLYENAARLLKLV